MHSSKKDYGQLLELNCMFFKLLCALFCFVFSITISLLAYLNLEYFLENLVSLHNYVGICRRTTIIILIGTFEDIYPDIESSKFLMYESRESSYKTNEM